MTRISTLLLAAWLAPSAASAQVHDGANNAPIEQSTADTLRAAGSKCEAPACRGTPDGVYPPSTRPGEGAKTPSISSGQEQPRN